MCKMSLVKIVQDYKEANQKTLDEKTFKAAIDTYKGDINILYEIYIAQESYNKLVDVLFDISNRLECLEDGLECPCDCCEGEG